MPRDAVSRTANVERNGGHKWVKELDRDMVLFFLSGYMYLWMVKDKIAFLNINEEVIALSPKLIHGVI